MSKRSTLLLQHVQAESVLISDLMKITIPLVLSILSAALGGFMSACSHLPPPPVAAEKPVNLEKHGDLRVDPYFWLKERENPEVIRYLEAENEYFEKAMGPVKGLREKLFQEFRSRLKEDDSSVPFRDGEFFYYARFETGKEYPIYARKKGKLDAPEEILLDVNEMAKGQNYFSVGFPKPSPDHSKILYAIDNVGRRFYSLNVMDLKTRKAVGEPIKDTTGNAQWANDNRTIFYSKQDPETLRSQWVYKHKLGEKKDSLVFEEKDEQFSVGVGKSRTDKYLLLESGASLSSEYRFLDADKPDGEFQVFLPREKEHEYSIDDGVDGFYIRTNWKAKNFRLMKAPRRAANKSEWVDVIPHRDHVYLDGFDVFKNHLVVQERRDGLTGLRVIDRKTGASENIQFPDPTYVVGVSTNAMYDLDYLRYEYESLNRPSTIYDFYFATKKSEVRKVQPTPNLDPTQYVSERVWATARDGQRVPISLVYKKGFQKNGKAPMLQYAYGSYGYSMEPWFGTTYMSLLDRGFVYAIAHIRGGSEMGRFWYEDGKFFKKKNTFTDFIDVTEHLVKQGYCDPKRVYGQGASAGGLLMGAVYNMRPDLYRGLHAGVPFVDVVTTMLDDSIPLTTGEYDEWGNPNKKDYYEYMKSYSPYDNVEKKPYTNLLVTSGLHDSQVQYWEPTKWVAKLRKSATNDPMILLKTEMKAGHGGKSGRFEQLHETADEYAFFLMLDGQKD